MPMHYIVKWSEMNGIRSWTEWKQETNIERKKENKCSKESEVNDRKGERERDGEKEKSKQKQGEK